MQSAPAIVATNVAFRFVVCRGAFISNLHPGTNRIGSRLGATAECVVRAGDVGSVSATTYDRRMQWRLLEGVSADDVRRLESLARRRRFDRNEVVFHRDDPGDSLHLIEKGRFAIRIMTPLGDTVTVAVRGPGENFGEMALVAAAPKRTATVVALERAETLAVYKDDFEQLRREHPEVDKLLLAFLVGEVHSLNERLLEALYMSVERRVLRRLRELTVAADQAGGPVEVPLTQEALAELAGTTRATINRILRDEEKRRTLRLERGRTVVLDCDDIARRAR
jgi:CRP-like cAMP-binding protein